MRRSNNTIPKLNIKKGDMVKVISGNYKGKTGRVIEVITDDKKLLVEGINIITKHTKPTAQHPEGGRIEKEAPIFISKVMLLDPKTGEPTRVGRRLDEKNKLVRYSKKSKETLS